MRCCCCRRNSHVIQFCSFARHRLSHSQLDLAITQFIYSFTSTYLLPAITYLKRSNSQHHFGPLLMTNGLQWPSKALNCLSHHCLKLSSSHEELTLHGKLIILGNGGRNNYKKNLSQIIELNLSSLHYLFITSFFIIFYRWAQRVKRIDFKITSTPGNTQPHSETAGQKHTGRKTARKNV